MSASDETPCRPSMGTLASALLGLSLLALGLWPLLRPLTAIERWLPPDRLLVLSSASPELIEQLLADEELRARVLVLPISGTAVTLRSEVCMQVGQVLGSRHPSFPRTPDSLLCRLVERYADGLAAESEATLFEGFAPVSSADEAAAWARYGLDHSGEGLVIIGRGRRPGSGPGYNREIGY